MFYNPPMGCQAEEVLWNLNLHPDFAKTAFTGYSMLYSTMSNFVV